MKPIDQQNYFELLDLPRSATSADVDQAYERAKAFYGPDSMATYALVDAGEARSLVERIEEAYLTLSDSESRRSYEAALGLCSSATAEVAPPPGPAPVSAEPASAASAQAPSEPPREQSAQLPSFAPAASEPARLEAVEPATAPERTATAAPSFAGAPAAAVPSFPWPGSRPVEDEHDFAARTHLPQAPAPAATPDAGPSAAKAPPALTAVGASAAAVERAAEAPAPPALTVAGASAAAVERAAEAPAPPALTAVGASAAAIERISEVSPAPLEAAPRAIASVPLKAEERAAEEPRPALPVRPVNKPAEIGPNPVFSGELLRRVRESRGLSLRDLSEKTRVGLSHLENVEADRYDALPVAVYLRGFLMLVARELKLDPLKVSKGYMELAAKAKTSKS